MHVWLVTVAEPIPSDNVRPMRFMGLAEQLLQGGHQVTIWTTSFFHHTKSHRFLEDTTYDVKPGYRVTVLRSRGYQKNVSVQRLLAHRHLARRLAQTIPNYPQPDLIVTSLPPLDTVSILVKYGVARQIPVVLDVIDPWPDFFLRLVPLRWRSRFRLLMAPLFWRTRQIFRQLSGVMALSQTYVDWALTLRGKDDIPSGAFYPAVNLKNSRWSAWQKPANPKQKQPKPMRFVYAGALSKSYDVETIIACARRLHEDGFSKAEFYIAGDGPKAPILNKLAKDLPNVKLLGWLEAEKLSDLYVESHVGIACYTRGAMQSVTYKLFDYLGAGLPILCSLPGEMLEIIEREQVGFFYPAENPRVLAKIIQQLSNHPALVREMGLRARAFAEQAGDSGVVYRRMAGFLERIAGDLQ